MKNLFVLLFSFITLSVVGQVHINDFYKNKDTYLIQSLEVETNKTQKEVIQSVKNWAGENFVNMNEVLVSETENQLVFRYVNNSYYRSWYLKMIVKIENQKVKISVYDGGNVGYYDSMLKRYVSPSTYFFIHGFNKENISRKLNTKGLLDTHSNINNTIREIQSVL